MNIKQSDKTIFNVIWESQVDAEFLVQVYPCDNLKVAQAMMKRFKNEILSNGHFSQSNIDDFVIEETDNRYFIIDNTDDYYEDIYIIEKKVYIDN